jgi:hypothetical protein
MPTDHPTHQPPGRAAARPRAWRLAAGLLGLAVALALSASPAAAQVAVTTHHYDNYRTGWNNSESVLSYESLAHPASASQRFGLLHTVSLDDQVDAQPLVVPKASIVGDPNAGSHDVVFVATENNTVYAIDPTRGTVLNSRNLGTPVHLPLGCTINLHLGVNSTPVIDLATNSLYVMAYVTLPSGPTYQLHRLALHDFSDVVPPVTVAATDTLTNGATTTFSATYEHQRAALLLSKNVVFAGFSSFCDHGGAISRGWLLGWLDKTLAPYMTNNKPSAQSALLTDRQATSPKTWFMSSIWMSGAGPATDQYGFVYLVTSNSDPSGTTYDGVTNLQESVLRFNPSTNNVVGVFTPYNVKLLDQGDGDFGAGGVLVLPTSVPGLPAGLVAAAGKFGNRGKTPGGPGYQAG